MDLKLYVITDEKVGLSRSHSFLAEEALKGGATAIQLRDKEKGGRELYRIGVKIRELTRRYKALFIVNDRLDIAMAVGADGVHLGTEDLPVSVARRIAGKNFIIGASVSSPEEALLAEKEGADYISAQSIFRTSSKENVKIIGLEGLRSIVNASSLPVIAIGGINKDNVKDVIRNGAKGIAVISAAVSEEDVKKAVEELRESLEEVL
ncbi:TPA: thiamine phosphate synthase [bacterium]|nr:thiamine phosphate synthase [bacterium]HRU32368.1 thiamine phosphate synthase [bacterium]